MTRRNFSYTSSVLAATSMMNLSQYANPATPQRYKMGYQLFSVNKDMNEDPIGTLVQLKAMGYEDFEIYGFDPTKVSYYDIPATDFKKKIDDLGLTMTSGHYGFTDYLESSESDLRHFIDQCIAGAKAIQSPYITWPWLDPKYRNMKGFEILVDKLNIIGKHVNQAGLGFAYHNHGFEFENHDGSNGYDLILSATDPELVKLQMDMYWVMHAGTTTPIELVQKHPNRYVMWHIKDMDVATRDYTELGNGSINYLNILPDPVESGLEYYYIEQGGNFSKSALASAAASGKYLKKHLTHLL